jgi:hypothetical protein
MDNFRENENLPELFVRFFSLKAKKHFAKIQKRTLQSIWQDDIIGEHVSVN